MKSKVRLSRYSLVVTFVILVALFVGCILTVRERIPFLILLYGDKYVLGCENPQAMADYIQSRLPAAA